MPEKEIFIFDDSWLKMSYIYTDIYNILYIYIYKEIFLDKECITNSFCSIAILHT